MTSESEHLDRHGYVVIPRHLDTQVLATAKAEISRLLESVDFGSGFDGSRTRRVWALLAKTRCMDVAATDPLILDLVDAAIGPGSQFGLTQDTQIHPGETAQPLHFEQGIYPLPRDRDVMITTIWALDDFTAQNGATRIVPQSHHEADSRPTTAIPVEMAAGSVLIFRGRLFHGGGPTRHPSHGSASSSTTPSRGFAHVRRIPSVPTSTRSAGYRNDFANYWASTNRRPISASSTDNIRKTG